jgi:hypothetical protein
LFCFVFKSPPELVCSGGANVYNQLQSQRGGESNAVKYHTALNLARSFAGRSHEIFKHLPTLLGQRYSLNNYLQIIEELFFKFFLNAKKPDVIATPGFRVCTF